MSRRTRRTLGLLAAVGLVAGCSSVEITAPPLQEIEEITFHPSLDVDLALMTQHESGLYYQDLEEGTGAVAESGNTVNVDFRGWIAVSGLLFNGDQNAQIILGVGEVPAGLDLAIQGMREGGRRRAVVPPLLGYGRLPRNNVPGGSVLVYEIELIEVFQGSP